MRTTRLNEYDLTRIVRRVLNEHTPTSVLKAATKGLPNLKNNTNPCFAKTTIKIPNSCTVKPLGEHILKIDLPHAGTGFKLGNGCLSDLGSMITTKNLTEITKILACLSKYVVA
jgi:hypothetical protein